jgi:hypothetical protein
VTIAPLDVPLSGGCLCGRVRYRIHEDPIAFYACHCTDCQRESGAPFGLSMVVRSEALEHLGGDVRRLRVPMSDGRHKSATRCTECGIRVWSESLRSPQIVWLSPGTLDDPRSYAPFGNMWTASAHSWVALAPGPRFERQPEDPLALTRAWQQHRRAAKEIR